MSLSKESKAENRKERAPAFSALAFRWRKMQINKRGGIDIWVSPREVKMVPRQKADSQERLCWESDTQAEVHKKVGLRTCAGQSFRTEEHPDKGLKRQSLENGKEPGGWRGASGGRWALGSGGKKEPSRWLLLWRTWGASGRFWAKEKAIGHILKDSANCALRIDSWRQRLGTTVTN